MSSHRLLWLAALAVLAPSCGGGGGDGEASARARPVTVLRLAAWTPPGANRFTGVVEPFREADVGFEVSGRVEFVFDVGTQVEGAVFDEGGRLVLGPDGSPVSEGDVIAQVDATRYQQHADAIRLQIESMKLTLAAQEVELSDVLSRDLESAGAGAEAARLDVTVAEEQVKSAQSSYDLARVTVERTRELVSGGIQSQADLDRDAASLENARSTLEQTRTSVEARTQALNSAQAAVAKARGAIQLKQADIETTRSELTRLDQQLETALIDLEDCTLRAPFSGRITEVYVNRGALVQPGTPVAKLTLFDPVNVSLTLSAEQAREIQVGDQAQVRLAGTSEDACIYGTVRDPGEVADPATRTFRVDVVVRNPLARTGTHRRDSHAPAVVAPVVQRIVSQGGPLYVFYRCIVDDGSGNPYVLRLPGWNSLRPTAVDTHGTFVPEKVPVTLGSNYFTVINWPCRELVDAGGLEAGDMLIIAPGSEDHESFRVSRDEWLLRPGDLVRVGIGTGNPPTGFYLPLQAIAERNGATRVYVVEDSLAREVPVTVHEGFQEMRRVEGEGLEPGARIVVQGVHYVADGERVEVLEEQEL